MRMQRPTLYLLVALGLLFCLQLTACGSQGMPGSQGKDGKSQSAQMAGPFSSSSQSTTDYAVPPVIVHDPAPGGLEVVFNVNMGGYGADREQTTIGLSFLSHGKVVQLADHEQLMCNGRDMSVHQQCWPISWCFMERLMLVGASRPSSCFNSKRSLASTAFHSSSVCIAFSFS